MGVLYDLVGASFGLEQIIFGFQIPYNWAMEAFIQVHLQRTTCEDDGNAAVLFQL